MEFILFALLFIVFWVLSLINWFKLVKIQSKLRKKLLLAYPDKRIRLGSFSFSQMFKYGVTITGMKLVAKSFIMFGEKNEVKKFLISLLDGVNIDNNEDSSLKNMFYKLVDLFSGFIKKWWLMVVAIIMAFVFSTRS